MKKQLHILATLLLALGLSGVSSAQQAQPLTTLDFTIVGVGIGVSPDYQAVPKGIASQVNTGYTAPSITLSAEVLDQLPKDYRIVAELTGPAYQSPLTLTAQPGFPFKLPTLPLLGKYTLSNIRLLDGSGNALFSATPQAVTIESIGDPLITNVQTRQLTLQEIQDRGVVVDSSNFTAYDFTVALGTESNQVPISFPVVIPNGYSQVNPDQLPPPSDLGVPPPVVSIPPPPGMPVNTSFEGFIMQVDADSDITEEVRAQLPPIPGVVVIPNNIGFLNQYFSALLLVTNGAPGQSNLVVRDLKATIALPVGKDTEAGSLDDPLKMAVGADGPFPSDLPVKNVGPDGKAGTQDDVSLLHPAESGQADFTIEGKKEGTHKIDFDITAILEGLPIGPVPIRGKASGAVLVRNPTFSITFSHPSTIRSGEGYEIFVTITNTSKTGADLVSLHLDSQAMSGARPAADETADRLIQTIAPGSSATVSYRLIAQRTGKVTATAMALDENLKGQFTLRAGVGDRNIPLSPDSLIIPYTGSLPADLVNAAVGLLGQAWSVATAPAGALPSDVLPIAKQVITSRANDLSETGIRILMGDAPEKAVGDHAFDFLGAEKADRGFDDLRRKSAQGLNLDRAMAAVFRNAAQASSVVALQQGMAERATSRPGHVSVVTSESPVRVQLTDGASNRTGGINPGEVFRDIPYGNQLVWTAGSGTQDQGTRSTLSLVTKVESASYRVDFKTDADAVFDLGIVVPDATNTLRQVTFSRIVLPANASAWVTLLPGTTTDYALSFDLNNDGMPDGTPLAASSVMVVPDLGPSVVAVTQMAPGFGPGGDKHGRNVAVLFSEPVAKESAQDIANYAVDENAVRVSFLQPSGRMAFLLLRDGIGPFVERSLTVSGITDLKQNAMEPSIVTLPILPKVAGPAAIVTGAVRSAQGEPVPAALVRLLQEVWIDEDFSLERRFVIFSEKPVKADGSYQFDYVLRNDDPSGPFRIEAVNPSNGESSSLTTNVQYHGQALAVDLFMKARGNVSGKVLDSTGNGVANAAVLIKTLNDGRSYSTTADAAGGFSFSNLRVGPFSLKAVSTALSAEGLTMGTLPDDGGTAVQDITIFPVAGTPMGTIAGKVLESDGLTPRGGVVVIVNGQNYQNWTRTAADGTYSFTGVFAGTVSISARDELTGMNAVASGQVGENATAVFNIILKGMGTVAGLIQREDGLSVAGFTVVANGGSVQRVAVTDSEGKFSFNDMPTGSVTVRLPDPRNPYSNLAYGTVTLISAGDSEEVLLWLPATQLATGRITGTVKKRDGSAWNGAEVWLIVDPAAGTYKPYTADGTGTFTIPDPSNPNDVLSLGSHQLVVREGAEIANATVQLWYDGQQATVELKAAALGTVSGTVRDEGSGQPTGADVTLISTKPDRIGWLKYDTVHPVTIKSDPQTGVYSFSGVYAGSFTVSASNILRPVPVAKSGSITTNNQNSVVDLLLKDTRGAISGTVLLPDGSPASDGVSLSVMNGELSVSTNTSGAFHFPFVPAGNYEVFAEETATLRRAKASVAVPAGGDVPVMIRLLGKGSITVRVVDGNGAPVEALISVEGSSFPNDLASSETATSGPITFGNLSEGSYAVSAVSQNNLGGRTTVTIPADLAQVTATVTIADFGTVIGRFLKPDGKTPVAGGQITLKNANRQVLAYTLTDIDPLTAGFFRLEHVPLGGFILEGYDPVSDRRGVGGGNISGNGQTVIADVIVTPRGTVKGTVMNNGGTMPVEGASVSISVEGVSNWGYSTVTMPDGGFTFAGVPAGKITVSATANGLYGKATGALTYEGETVKTDIRLQATASITGTVFLPLLDAAGQPIKATNTTVTVNSVTKQVDGSGLFLFTNLPIGMSYSVVARELGSIGGLSNRAGRAVVTLTTDGETGHADVLLQGIGTVEGYVHEPLSAGSGTLGLASVTLYASGKDGLVYHAMPSSSNDSGYFKFTHVPVGTFTLRATHPDRLTAASATGTVLNEGDVVAVDLHLGNVGTVAGTVLLPRNGGNAIAGGVRYTGCGLVLNTTIGTDGRFQFDNVPLCTSFDIYAEHAQGPAFGVGRAHDAMLSGTITDIGTIILDDQAPSVIDWTPALGAPNVPISKTASPITVTFSEPMDKMSVQMAMSLNRGAALVTQGTVTLNTEGTIATFTPYADLDGFTVYTLVVKETAQDTAKRPLAAPFSSTFTTRDITPPTVSSFSPAKDSFNVPTGASMRVTFSEAIASIPAGGIRLSLLDGQNAVPQAVSVTLLPGNTTAVVAKEGGLLPNATYRLTVSGIQDPAGHELQGTEVCVFGTLDTIAPTISTLSYPAGSGLIEGNKLTIQAAVADTDVAYVDFFVDGSHAAFTDKAPYAFELLLSHTGPITVTAVAQDRTGNRTPTESQPVLMMNVVEDRQPAVAISAPASVHPDRFLNLSVSAVDDLAIKEIVLEATGAFVFKETRSISTGVTTTQYFSQRVPPDAQLGGSIILKATAIDSSGKTTEAFGTVLIKDTEKPWITIASQSSPGTNKPKQTGTSTVVAGDLISVVTTSCSATGAATGGQTIEYGTASKQVTSSFEFIVLESAKQNDHITLSCSAWDVAGNSSSTFTTVLVGDDVRPAVSVSSPAPNAENVPIDAVISVTFNDALRQNSVYGGANGTVRLRTSDGTEVPGTVSLNTYNYQTVTFAPLPALTRETTYTLTITTGVADQADNYLEQDYVLSFTTVPPDRIPPAVLSISPTGTGVSVATAVVATFSEDMSPATVTRDSFVLSSATGTVNAALSYNSSQRKATLQPSAQLDFNKEYSILLTTQITDSTGNGLASAVTSTFKTGGFAITTPKDKSSIISGSSTTLAALAAGNQGITMVKFYVDGVFAGQKANTPYSISYSVPVVGQNDQAQIWAEALTSSGTITAPVVHVIILLPDNDDDGDGLTNAQEIAAGSDPLIVDTDGDGLADYEEVMDYHTDPTNPDTDGDGLTDYEEVVLYHTDPLKADTDGDGFKDGEEVKTHHTDPLNPDTDGDGLLDDWEVKYGLNPLSADTGGTGVPDGDKDIDKDQSGNVVGDGIPNKYELCLGLDSTKVKTDNVTNDGLRDGDGDGWTNYDEVNIYHTNPCLADTDDDGVVDKDEYVVLHTSPTNSQDLHAANVELKGETIRIIGKAVFNNLTLSKNATGTADSMITTLGSTTSNVSMVDIEVKGTMRIDAGSSIDLTGKGYLGGNSGGNAGEIGRTFGNTTIGGSMKSNGGSYGGVGGIGYFGGSANKTYGSATEPSDPGSGGGVHGLIAGGNGGGILRIAADTMVLDGTILVDGESKIYPNDCYYIGAGSGGGIFLKVTTLSGSGAIKARGGSTFAPYFCGYSETVVGGAGGGGRIAIEYATKSFPTANIDTSGGKARLGLLPAWNGSPGTIYLKSTITQKGELLISSSSGTLSNPTPIPNNISDQYDLSIIRSTVTVSGPLQVPGILSLSDNSVLTHDRATSSKWSSLIISTQTITIDSTSRIDVSARGFLGGYQGDNSTSNFGLSVAMGSQGSTGGSYGGMGGFYKYVPSNKPNVAYGDIASPDFPGSGGGGYFGSIYPGGNGGGFIHITANTLTVEGGILADGGIATQAAAGGGSGGSILINTNSLNGNGTISARGGDSTSASGGGGGGGGRIAVSYKTLSTPVKTKMNASGGRSGVGAELSNGGAGTIYLKHVDQLHGDLIVDNKGLGTSNVTPISNVTFASLTIHGGAVITMNGNVTADAGLTISNANLIISGGLDVKGDLLFSGSTVTASGRVSTSGKMELANGTVLAGIDATTTSISRLDIVSGELQIDEASVINVTGKGYLGGYSGVNGSSANGKTSGNVDGSNQKNGGSYAGLGGLVLTTSSLNAVYGDYAVPNDAGSGGGGYSTASPGGNGGGLVTIATGTMNVAGKILADGQTATYGGGSGGAIVIDAKDISGTGMVRAAGGGSSLNGAGGGGRIAIYFRTLSPDMIVSAVGGTGGVSSISNNGGAGTIYLKDESMLRGDLIIDNGGIVSRDESTLLRAVGRGQITGVAMNTLSNSSATWTAGTLKGLLIKPDIRTNVTYTVVDNTATSVTVDPPNAILSAETTYSGVYLLRDMRISGNAKVACDDQLELSGDLLLSGSRLVAREIIADNIFMDAGSLLTHRSATTTSSSRLELNTLNTLVVAQTATIDVSAKGYLGGYSGTGNNSSTGRTYGNTTVGGSTSGNGGSFGGRGGRISTAPTSSTNTPYDTVLHPKADELGSGGGGISSTMPGGNGGGLVQIKAQEIVLNGQILAKGGDSVPGSTGGAGSGGGIHVEAGTLSGEYGEIRADGGSSNSGGGGGGGGIISLFVGVNSLDPLKISVDAGLSGSGGNTTYNGAIGQIVQ